MTPITTDQLAVDATQMPARERWRRAFAALAKVVADPDRTEQVLVFSIYANAGSMQRRIERFYENADARRLYEQRRTIDSSSVDLDALAALPADTLGHAYASFLRSRGLTPAVFDAPPSQVSDPRMQYVVQRLRQTHDLWHVVTGHDTDAPSEIALQAFTFAQVRAPSSAILATVGMLRAIRQKPTLPRDVAKSFRLGLRAERLAAFPWEDHWSTPLHEVRRLLGIPAGGIEANRPQQRTQTLKRNEQDMLKRLSSTDPDTHTRSAARSERARSRSDVRGARRMRRRVRKLLRAVRRIVRQARRVERRAATLAPAA